MANSTHTKTSPGKQHSSGLRLLEIASGFDRVDAAKGVIYGVKVVGTKSINVGRTIGLDPKEFGDAVNKPYEYSKQAFESALSMYEGATVRIDHPQMKRLENGQRVADASGRSSLSTFGQLKGCVVREDGIYADLEYIKSHSAAAFVAEVAERMPTKLALSHNAFGVPVLKNGRAVIDRIIQVYSVDIVGDKPGTTNGLFETFEEPSTMKRTVKQIVESAPKETFGRALLAQLLEDDAMPADMPVETATDANSDDQIKAAFRAMVVAAFDDESLDSKATLAKIKDILAAQEKLSDKPANDAGATAAAESAAGKTKPEDPKVKQLMEDVASLKAERDSLAADAHARSLLETANREVTDVRIKAVKSLETDADRKALIETWSEKDEAPATVAAPRPRTSAPVSVAESYEQAAGGEEFARRLKLR